MNILLNSFYAFLGSLGFGVIFNIRGKNLIFASLGGFIGWFTFSIFRNTNNSIFMSLFLGTVALSIYSEVMARVRKAPVTIFSICALIPLVPGSGMYYTMSESVKGNIQTSIELAFQTLSSAGAIAVAVLLVSTLSKLIAYLHCKKRYKKKTK